jgi:hypothetical protein
MPEPRWTEMLIRTPDEPSLRHLEQNLRNVLPPDSQFYVSEWPDPTHGTPPFDYVVTGILKVPTLNEDEAREILLERLSTLGVAVANDVPGFLNLTVILLSA